MHPCSQQEQINKLIEITTKHDKAFFGNEEEGEVGMIMIMKETSENVKKMLPTYEEINNWSTFFKKGKQLGLGLTMFITAVGVVTGALLAIKEWFKH